MTREFRALPTLAAGPVEMPSAIQSWAEDFTRDIVWNEHSHPFHELLWNEWGASTFVVGSRVWTVTSTVGLWMPAGTLHSGSAPAGTRCRAGFFGFGATSSISPTPVGVEITPLLRLLLERLADTELASESRAVTEAMVVDVLVPSSRELLVRMPAGELLRPIADAVRSDPGDRRTLADWAVRLGVSARTISRAFNDETGMSFVRWVARVRAQHAIELLARGREIDAVAEEVGYRSASAFGAAFRRTTGLTPGAFRAP
ncbi:AraC family transcriptional regulator [Actinomadura spongiicola]|uniref:HTH-type transcriptional regulator RipA n=1 Tax=Actinomadura spongiicola TaxID=2303421 RepID=A0A372GD90_9ACTN|nr:AraC family transcriptional regulator [Actinomadura spongiicola]RFS83043.1 AraC family transcriptional regulator [Actinomadura spongiicola]